MLLHRTASQPLIEKLDLAKDKAGRILTNSHLLILGRENEYAIGDCANVEVETPVAFPPPPLFAGQWQRIGSVLAPGRTQGFCTWPAVRAGRL